MRTGFVNWGKGGGGMSTVALGWCDFAEFTGISILHELTKMIWGLEPNLISKTIMNDKWLTQRCNSGIDYEISLLYYRVIYGWKWHGFCVEYTLSCLASALYRTSISVHMAVKAAAKCHILNDYHSAPNNVSLFGFERRRVIIGSVTMKKLLVLFLEGTSTLYICVIIAHILAPK